MECSTEWSQDAEWDWLFSPETFRGRDQLLRAAADWIETVDGWQIEVEDVIDGTRGRVVVIVRVVARGRGSGVPVYQRVFSVITVRDGKIARIHDYTERAKPSKPPGSRSRRCRRRTWRSYGSSLPPL